MEGKDYLIQAMHPVFIIAREPVDDMVNDQSVPGEVTSRLRVKIVYSLAHNITRPCR